MFKYCLWKDDDGELYIIEVFYNFDGRIIDINKEPELPHYDNKEDIIHELRTIIKDIANSPILSRRGEI